MGNVQACQSLPAGATVWHVYGFTRKPASRVYIYTGPVDDKTVVKQVTDMLQQLLKVNNSAVPRISDTGPAGQCYR